MALVTKCDRCGEITETPAKLQIKEHSAEYRIELEYDLCRKCREELDAFLTEGERDE